MYIVLFTYFSPEKKNIYIYIINQKGEKKITRISTPTKGEENERIKKLP